MAVTVTQTNPNDLETVYTYTMSQANDTSTAVPIWAGDRVMWQITAYAGSGNVTLQYSLDGTNWVTGQEGAGAALAVVATEQAAAGARIYSLQPARFARIVNGASVTSSSSVLVVRRNPEVVY